MNEGLKIGVIGDGGWGTALGLTAAANGHKVTVWSPFPENVEAFTKSGENNIFLPGLSTEALSWTAERGDVALCDLIIMAVPSQFYRAVAASFKGIIPPKACVVSVSKGLERDTNMRLTQIAEECLGIRHVGALSGPSHAEEVARRIPTAVTVASEDEALTLKIQNTLSNKYFRIYTSDDKAGVELGGALKNVIAVAVGVSDGMGFGDNTRAALITRGLAEIIRLGRAMGAQPETFAGLSGMGDLIVTCTSRHSRNRSVGERLGKGESISDILSSTKQVAEGVWNAMSAHQCASAHNIEVPITDEVCAVVNDNKSPAEAVQSLLTRDMKPE